jgi:ketosteroid isomerase-like protein
MAGDREARIRAMFVRFNGTQAPVLDDLDPEIEWHLRADLPDSRTLHGHEDVKQLVAEWTAAFEDFQTEPVEVSEVAGRTIAVLHAHGRVRGSGQEVDMDEVWVFGWNDERIVEIREYRTKDEALEALGSIVER